MGGQPGLSLLTGYLQDNGRGIVLVFGGGTESVALVVVPERRSPHQIER